MIRHNGHRVRLEGSEEVPASMEGSEACPALRPAGRVGLENDGSA